MKLRSFPRTQRALSLLEVLVVVSAIVLLWALLLAKLRRPASRAQRVNCVNNLKQIGLCFRIWSGDNADKYPMQVSAAFGGTMELVGSGSPWPHFQVMSNELNTPKIIVCPEDDPRSRELAKIITSLTDFRSTRLFSDKCPVSYFVGVDAEEAKTNHFLVGDDNLLVRGKRLPSGMLHLWTNSVVGWTGERHAKAGNVCLADGSVRILNNKQLRQALANTGVATNRLAMP